MKYGMYLLLLFLGRGSQSDFYGYSLLLMFLGIFLFQKFGQIEDKIKENKEKEYFYSNKMLLKKSLCKLETIGIILSIVSFLLSFWIETLYFRLLILFFMIYPFFFVFHKFLKGNDISNQWDFSYLLYFLLIVYFFKKDFFIFSFYIGISIITILTFLQSLISFLKQKKKFHFDWKEKREEFKEKSSLKNKMVWDFKSVLIVKCLIELLFLFLLEFLFSFDPSLFLNEVISYVLWYPILLYPIFIFIEKKISNITKEEEPLYVKKVLSVVSLSLIFICTMISFFEKDLLLMIYNRNSDIFKISCFSLFFLTFLSYCYQINIRFKRKNKKRIALYLLLKIIISPIFVKFSYLINIPSLVAYFIVEEIILFILCVLELKKYSKMKLLSYEVIRYKIIKIVLCSMIVYGVLLNITHWYDPLDSIILSSVLMILLLSFSVFLYHLLIKKSHLLYSILSQEELKKMIKK